MDLSLKKRFKARAAVIVVALSSVMGGCSSIPDIRSGGDDKCLPLGNSTSVSTDYQKKVAQMFSIARSSPTATTISNNLASRNVYVCYEPALKKENSRDGITVGNYVNTIRRVNLNPTYSVDRLMETFVHEIRHAEQDARNVHWYKRGNIREEQRVMIQWLTEADARLAGIVFAYEMQQAGNSKFMNRVKRDSWYRPMVRAFEKSLKDNPGDIHRAMRQSLKAFRATTGLAKHYDYKVASWANKRHRSFDPKSPEKILVTDELLKRIGDMGPYGNYMNDEMMDFIRGSVTPEYYSALKNSNRYGLDSEGGPIPDRMID